MTSEDPSQLHRQNPSPASTSIDGPFPSFEPSIEKLTHRHIHQGILSHDRHFFFQIDRILIQAGSLIFFDRMMKNFAVGIMNGNMTRMGSNRFDLPLAEEERR